MEMYEDAWVMTAQLNEKKDGCELCMRPLVLCKNCKYWYFADNRIPSEQENVCGRNGIVVTPYWFCADGERRTDDA